MFERITVTKWRLTKDSREQFGALLIYMRNEWAAAATMGDDVHPNSCSETASSTAKNYRKMVECIDRLLARLDGSFDAHRMAHAYGVLSQALSLSPTGRLSRQAIDKASATYGTMGFDSSGDRSNHAGNYQLPGTWRDDDTGRGDGTEGDGASASTHEADGH